MASRRSLIGMGFLLGLALAPRAASAQDGDRARARALFAQGVALVEEHRWSEAEPVFREALELYEAPSIRYNLASTLFEQGEYPEASALVDRLLSDPETPENIREPARQLRAHIDEQAGYARVRIEGGGGETIDVDGWRLSDPSEELALAPGGHVARATRDDLEVAREEFQLRTGQHLVVRLHPPAAPREEEPSREVPPARGPQVYEEWWFWAVIVGVVAIGVGVGVGVALGTGSGTAEPYHGNFMPGVIRW